MTSVSGHASLNIKSDLNNLARVREFVRDFLSARSSRMQENQIVLIELAANEVAANIMRHAYHGNSDGTITIETECRAGQIKLLFYDHGDAWDPQTAPPPAFDGSKDGGFGLYIIEQAVDGVAYSRDANGVNCACLTITLKEENNGFSF